MQLKAYINPKVLAWARVSAGYSIAEVVAKLSRKTVTNTTVSLWESGEDLPTYAQFETLAKLYRRPTALFYLSQPPKDEAQEKFRSVPAHYTKELPRKIRFIVRDALVRQINLEELHNGSQPTKSPLLGLANIEKDTKTIASYVRKLLGISTTVQQKWSSPTVAYKKWRAALEQNGLWVFNEAIDDAGNYEGFFLEDESFPVIYINNSAHATRQIFTLFHELGHVLLARGGIFFRDDFEKQLRGNYRAIEQYCNSFAGEFLVPDADFSLPKKVTEAVIRKYAKLYHVSKEVILRKLREKNLITASEYNQYVNLWRSQYRNHSKAKSSGGHYLHTQRKYLGDKYIKLAFNQFYRQNITENQLAKYLNVKIDTLPKLEALVPMH